MTEAEFLTFLRQQVQEKGQQKALAERAGVSQSYLNDIVHGRRNAGDRVSGALGFRRVVTYERIDAQQHAQEGEAGE